MVLVASDHKDGRGALSSNNSGPGKEDHPQTVPEFTLLVSCSVGGILGFMNLLGVRDPVIIPGLDG